MRARKTRQKSIDFLLSEKGTICESVSHRISKKNIFLQETESLTDFISFQINKWKDAAHRKDSSGRMRASALMLL